MSEPSSGSEDDARPARGLGDRVAGAVVVGFGLVLWFVAIPDQIDAVDYGWMRPQTLPGICAAALGLLGALLIVRPGHRAVTVDIGQAARLSALLLLLAAALLATDSVGFLAVAPFLAGVLAVLLGERRWPWLLAAAVGAPAAIWLAVSVLLQRPLP